MRNLILGTAGHIDHGKTELVRALTGVDTDRLREEKERGITIELGFAQLDTGRLRFGVVDVPGHEGFVRTMLAGATGMDVVLLVVAADEGVMPQTREHVSIVSLLGVERMVVAITKSDLVEEAWLELVRDEVRELLEGTPFDEVPLVSTSARTGAGLDRLVAALEEAAGAEADREDDLARLPVDRVFTVRGTGLVVTGTLWSGALATGDRTRVLPGDLDGRVRGLEVHGQEVSRAHAGERVAVALSGQNLDRDTLARGQVLVTDRAWESTYMLTARLGVVADSSWVLEHGQRVRVHLGTAEVMARVVLFDGSPLVPGAEGWGQLRLEAPVVARARERFVIRSYSPVTTIGGGQVVEPTPPKRKRLRGGQADLLARILEGDRALGARARLAGWSGEPVSVLPVTTGGSRAAVERELATVSVFPGSEPSEGPVRTSDHLLDGALVAEAVRRVLEAVERFHREEPLRLGVSLEALRQELAEAPAELADAVITHLGETGVCVVTGGLAARVGFRPTLTPAQERLKRQLAERYERAGLTPPSVEELPAELREARELWPLLAMLERDGALVRLEDEIFVWSTELERARRRVQEELAGREGLGPSDFKDAIPVSRKHLIPILAYFDRTGVTERDASGRSVREA